MTFPRILVFTVVEGYIWRYAKRRGATIFFRGIRSWEADGADERALQILNTWVQSCWDHSIGLYPLDIWKGIQNIIMFLLLLSDPCAVKDRTMQPL